MVGCVKPVRNSLQRAIFIMKKELHEATNQL
jgi:hypothetical protein